LAATRFPLAPTANEGLGVEHLSAGGVASRFTVTEPEPVPTAVVAWQLRPVPAVSAVIGTVSQPELDLITDAVLIVQPACTSPTYQPAWPSWPVSAAVTDGRVVSG